MGGGGGGGGKRKITWRIILHMGVMGVQKYQIFLSVAQYFKNLKSERQLKSKNFHM